MVTGEDAQHRQDVLVTTTRLAWKGRAARELADVLGCESPHARRLLKGMVTPTVPGCATVAAYLGVELRELLGDEGDGDE